MISHTAILILCKVPFHTQCKTRMQPQLNERECSLLQDAFLKDILNMSARVPYDVFVAYAPSSGAVYFEGQDQLRSYFPQREGDLGQRIIDAMEQVADYGYQKIIIIGGDSPELQKQTLIRAERMLDEADICIGPSADGGYYLIGLKQLDPHLFQYIEWGTDQVYRQTVHKATLHHYQTVHLPQGYDIDDWQDLISLHDRLRQQHYECYPAHTKRLLETLRPHWNRGKSD